MSEWKTTTSDGTVVTELDLIKMLAAVIDDFLPNIGQCALQDYGRLNTALLLSALRIKDAEDGESTTD